MIKCGKGLLPECEYYTSAGCVSPFNCPYKVEEISINSATSTLDTGIQKYFQGLVKVGIIPQEPVNYDAATLKMYIAHLETENAELRVRLEKAVELPFFQKDGEVIVVIYKDKGGIVCVEKYLEDEFYEGVSGLEAAEARLEEIKENNND